MSPRQDSFVELIEAAGEAQLRMQIEHCICLIERYLAGHADFAAWCRANLQTLADEPPSP